MTSIVLLITFTYVQTIMPELKLNLGPKLGPHVSSSPVYAASVSGESRNHQMTQLSMSPSLISRAK